MEPKKKILSSDALSSNLSSGKCLPIAFDSHMLEAFMASPHQINFAAIVTVTWKAPTLPYVKVNTYSYVIGESAACGGIYFL